MPIYTRTGDKGQTSLFNGQRVSKDDLRVEAYGTVDELNSAICMVIAESQKSKVKSQKYNSKVKSELVRIQNDLFEIGSLLADTENGKWKMENGKLEKRVKDFENEIDDMTEKMPALSNFILPGGGKTGSILHFARTVARRAERRVVSLSKSEKVNNNVIMYLNRLSDLLFTMSRFINYKEKQKEIIWPSFALSGASAGKSKK